MEPLHPALTSLSFNFARSLIVEPRWVANFQLHVNYFKSFSKSYSYKWFCYINMLFLVFFKPREECTVLLNCTTWHGDGSLVIVSFIGSFFLHIEEYNVIGSFYFILERNGFMAFNKTPSKREMWLNFSHLLATSV